MIDPARVADAAPEDPTAADAVLALGVGPGNPAFVTPRTSRALSAADVVVGFESVIGLIDDRTDADLLSCGYDDQGEILRRFADRVDAGEDGVAVLWGDPNVSGYQFLGRLQAAVDRPLRVVPGISSVQVAASRARTPIERAAVVTLHRRGEVTDALDRLAAAAGDRHLLVLVRPYDWMPPAIADALSERGVDPALEALVLEELTLPEESIERTTLAGLAALEPDEGRYSELTILAVRADAP